MPHATFFRCAALTDVGRVRAHNEDCVLADPSSGLLAVADGVGGHQAGEVASRLAIDTLHEAFVVGQSNHTNAPLELERAVRRANERIFLEGHRDPRCAGMGTTLVAALLRQDPDGTTLLTLAHVGDSRLYRFRPALAQGHSELVALTRDHSALQEIIDRGLHDADTARRLVPRNYLTRALGIDTTVLIDQHSEALQTGDLLLLCSDGLTTMLEDETLLTLLERLDEEKKGNPAAIAQHLIDAANARGGHDNISVVVAILARDEPRSIE